MSDQKLAEPAAQSTGIVSPARLAHLVLRTSRIKEMLAWYKLVLGAEVAFENDEIAFLAYDDEHHRIAFVQIPGLDPQPAGMVGMHHIAFTYDSLDELLGIQTGQRRRGRASGNPAGTTLSRSCVAKPRASKPTSCRFSTPCGLMRAWRR